MTVRKMQVARRPRPTTSARGRLRPPEDASADARRVEIQALIEALLSVGQVLNEADMAMLNAYVRGEMTVEKLKKRLIAQGDE